MAEARKHTKKHLKTSTIGVTTSVQFGDEWVEIKDPHSAKATDATACRKEPSSPETLGNLSGFNQEIGSKVDGANKLSSAGTSIQTRKQTKGRS